MNRVFVHGQGAVSPAGWGIERLREAVAKKTRSPVNTLARPGWDEPLTIRHVPPADSRPAFFSHARLRRASPIAQYSVAAALEAIGQDREAVAAGKLRLGVVLCVMSGCVNYTRRFYDETLRDPSTASPLVFPETVFNAPASHLASVLGTPAINYTLVGDPGTFLQGLALAAHWLADDRVDGCLVVGAEECDWLTADAFRLFSRGTILSDGAGALYLRAKPDPSARAELKCVTDAHLFTARQNRFAAAHRVRTELPDDACECVLVDGVAGVKKIDAAEKEAWQDWHGPRISPKTALGEGLMAAAAWQCALAVDAVNQNGNMAANVSVVGCNQQAIGAQFVRCQTST